MVESAGNPSEAIRVDPDVLRTFAQRLGAEAGAVTGLAAGEPFAVPGLPGTGIGAAAEAARAALDGALHRIGARLTTVADNLRTAAGGYELNEAEFAQRLGTIGLPS
ncbi:type VII secretion target [Nocardia harenae]|uniref:type VII secretion target n=1 Tax=Nocardia harenae TaxID=358707 RepID=UPI000833F0E2|nr:type VII secretion target [Nocardia harenae]